MRDGIWHKLKNKFRRMNDEKGDFDQNMMTERKLVSSARRSASFIANDQTKLFEVKITND